jgi:broad specificity phosphatase PhoE
MSVDRLVLVRSAATAATRRAAFAADELLDAGGVRAAERLAEVLGRVDTARSGPGRRARMTALAAGLTAAVDPDLAGPDPGPWSGRTLEQVAARDPQGLAAWLDDPDPDGALRARVGRFLERAHGWSGTTVAVTHGGWVRTAVLLTLDAPPGSFWRVDVAPASLTVLHRRDQGWVLARVNWTAT